MCITHYAPIEPRFFDNSSIISNQQLDLEKDPDHRVQHAILLVFEKFFEPGSVRQTLLWFLEQGLEMPERNQFGEICWKRPSYSTVYRILNQSGLRRLGT